jgi:hypothetical protein
MSLSFTLRDQIPRGLPVVWKLVDITMDTDYPSNGWAVAAADFGLRGLIAVIPLGQEDGYIPVWDRSAGKLKMMMGDNNNTNDGPAVDCDSGRNDLDTKIVTCLVVGW